MNELIEYVNQYNYPALLYSFHKSKEISFNDYRALEGYINQELFSSDLDIVKNGLSNVLYWGHYRAGYRDVRVSRFRNNVTDDQLRDFQVLVSENSFNCLNLKAIGMPEYSGLAFISKVLMFLNPKDFVTLDKKIMQLRDANCYSNPLTHIVFGQQETRIRINNNSQEHYLQWCMICKSISEELFQDKLAVDIERGFFRMVEDNQLELGRQIICEYTNNN